MRRIDKMMQDALVISESLRDTIFLILFDLFQCETEIHLQTVYGVEIVRKTHPNQEAAERYIEEMKEKYRVDPDMAMLEDDYLISGKGVIIDNIPEGG